MERRPVNTPSTPSTTPIKTSPVIVPPTTIKTTQDVPGLYFAKVKKQGLEFISTGCTLLDCVLGGGWAVGRMSNLVGDKSSGKTLLAIEACCNFNLLYPDGRIIYLEAESAFDEEYARALGMPVDAIEFISKDLKDNTVESWFEHMQPLLVELQKSKQPCLYIVDSLDALSDRAERDRDIDKGSYGAEKPKLLGQLFRRTISEIQGTRTHLMIISQLRDAIGVTFGERQKRSGGRALDFYASQILWLAQLKKLERTVTKQTRVYGTQVKAKCKKNKVGLPFRDCEFQILFGYGIDDINAMLVWLESIDCKDSILEIVDKTSYRNAAELTTIIKKLPRDQRMSILNELSALTIEQWEAIESKFLPASSKY